MARRKLRSNTFSDGSSGEARIQYLQGSRSQDDFGIFVGYTEVSVREGRQPQDQADASAGVPFSQQKIANIVWQCEAQRVLMRNDLI